jgi:cation diffusion facilitator family transporter
VLTDCWTSLAVLVGLGLVLVTKWLPFDPICGIIMAGNILFSGIGLMRSAFAGLMDRVDLEVHQKLTEILDRETAQRGLSYHHLRHRHLGDAHWVELHLVFPGGTALAEAHQVATAIEQVVEKSIEPRAHVTTHLESATDHDDVHPDHRTSGTG